MMATRGRGYAPSNNTSSELRKPGEAGLRDRFGNSTASTFKTNTDVPKNSEAPQKNTFSFSQFSLDAEIPKTNVQNVFGLAKMSSNTGVPNTNKTALKNTFSFGQINGAAFDEFSSICSKIAKMDLSSPKPTLEFIAQDIKLKCDSSDKLQQCVDSMVTFALQSKWNAHAVAVICELHGDLAVQQASVRNLILKKLQSLYRERNKSYQSLDKFVLEATFACEIYHHVRIGGVCLRVLSRPIIDYLGMLVDGASQKEIQVFVEQFPKCYRNLKENDSVGMDTLLTKIRKGIVSEITTVTVKAMLLEMFELALTDWKDLSQDAKTLYVTFSKPIVRICD